MHIILQVRPTFACRVNDWYLDETEDGCPYSGFSTESILADIEMNYYATWDVNEYIQAAVADASLAKVKVKRNDR